MLFSSRVRVWMANGNAHAYIQLSVDIVTLPTDIPFVQGDPKIYAPVELSLTRIESH